MAANQTDKSTGYPQVFILGAPGSGTTAMQHVFTQALGYAGPWEGQYFTVLKRINSMFAEQKVIPAGGESHKRSTIFQSIDRQRLLTGITELFLAETEALFPNTKWCDKTPGGTMVSFVPALAVLFPQALFVFMRRRGIENVLSQMKRFQGNFKGVCTAWAGTMTEWLKVRDCVLDRCLEFDQLELARAPHQVALRLQQFLQLEECCMQLLEKVLTTQFPQRTSADPGRQYSLSQTHWTQKQKNIFEELCGPVMKSYGYPLELDRSPGSGDLLSFVQKPGLGVRVVTENILNQWCRLPESIHTPTFTLHPNAPSQPELALSFLEIDKGRARILSFDALLNPRSVHGVRLRLLVQSTENNHPEPRLEKVVFLSPGLNSVVLELPESPCINFCIALSTVEGARSASSCAVSFSNVCFSAKSCSDS
jgi:hypothetical protein